MTSQADLDSARAAFAEHRWSDALNALTDADLEAALTPADLERLSTAGLLGGEETSGIDLATRAHDVFNLPLMLVWFLRFRRDAHAVPSARLPLVEPRPA